MRLSGVVGAVISFLLAIGAVDVAFADAAPTQTAVNPTSTTAAPVPSPASTAAQTTAPTPVAKQSNEKFWFMVIGIALVITLLTVIVVRRGNRSN